MNMHLITSAALALLLAAGSAHAEEVEFQIPAQSAQVGVSIDVSADVKIMSVKAQALGQSGQDGSIAVYVKDGSPFNGNAALHEQADYWANSSGGPASLFIGTYATPALHEGKWQFAIANYATHAATVKLEVQASPTTRVPTEFVVNFDAASAALEAAFEGADNLSCDTDPWHDDTPLAGTGGSIGAFRKGVIRGAVDALSTQIHSPLPVHVQACWQDFGEAADDGSYTLAAATGTYMFHSDQGMDLRNTWYAMAPAERLAGRRACQQYSNVDCDVPEIVVWFNSNEVAKNNYQTPSLEPRVRSVMMHEITHGLGFLGLVDVKEKLDEKDDDGEYLDNPEFMKLSNGLPDAYIANVSYLKTPAGGGAREPVPFTSLSIADRKAAASSKQYLVWDDDDLAADPRNTLSSNPWPRSLAQLHAPDPIRPGSTLSHLAAVHTGQLMTAFIQPSNPQDLGMAEHVLGRVGWHTDPADDAPWPGNWYDPAHSGHGIDLERVSESADGTIYVATFYTYDANGRSEYYSGGMLYRNGRMGDMGDPRQPAAMGRPIYDPVTRKATYPDDGTHGTIAIDFGGAAINHPACAGREAPALALMHWELGPDSGTWCISPIIGPQQWPTPEQNLNALWNAGSDDSGWGLTVLHTDEPGGMYFNPILFYYDADNQPRWATPGKILWQPGQTAELGDPQGYCRTCTPVDLSFRSIGTITLGLHEPEPSYTPSGTNWVSVDINAPGGPHFQRSQTPISMFAEPRD